MSPPRKIDWLRPAYLGPQFAIALVVGWYIGSQWIDPWLNSYPVGTIVFTGFGIASGFVTLFREVASLNRQLDEQKRTEEPGASENDAEEKDRQDG